MNIEFSDAYLGQLWERIDWSAAEAKLYAFQDGSLWQRSGKIAKRLQICRRGWFGI